VLPPGERVSQQELQRRYEAIRAKMKERGLEVLLVSGIRFVAAAGYLRYLTNWAEPFGGELLIFPYDGAPTFLARTGERAFLVKNLLGLEATTGCAATHAAEALKKTRCGRVGICGLKTMVAEFYVQLIATLPGVEFIEASSLLDEVRMIKSEEELGWVKKSANLTDTAFQVFSQLVRAGRSESDVFVEVEHVVKQLGAENTYFMMAADPKPVPKFLDLAFGHYQKGDIILFNAEISGPGGYFTQLERTLSLGEPSKEAKEAYHICISALEAGESGLRPGKKTIDVYNAIRTTIEQAGSTMGLHPGHSQGLDIFERPLLDGKDDVELKENMVIVLHPHVLMPSGGGVWIGETYIIKPEGCYRLHKSKRELLVL
jgi:Xaa-Pro aminopeptidase